MLHSPGGGSGSKRVSLVRSRSIGSRAPRMSQVSVEEDELFDTYFYGSYMIFLNFGWSS